MTLGGLFSEIYSFESSLYDFWILVIFGGPFLCNFSVFEIFENVFGMRMGDFGGGLFSEIYSFESFLYDFWILINFGCPFLGLFLSF